MLNYEKVVFCHSSGSQHDCVGVCGEVNPKCGHICNNRCVKCEEKRRNTGDHLPCQTKCGKAFPCGHECQSKCHIGESCPPCTAPCVIKVHTLRMQTFIAESLAVLAKSPAAGKSVCIKTHVTSYAVPLVTDFPAT